MSERSYGSRAYPFLQNALFKWAWGESPDLYDPGDLLDYLRPALGEALNAIDDPNEAAGILLDLTVGENRQALTRSQVFLRASMREGSTSALARACNTAVEKGGVVVVELLVEMFVDELEAECVADLLFDTCRLAVTGIADLTQRLDVLRTAYERIDKTLDDPDTIEILREGREAAAQQQEVEAAEKLLDHYFEAARSDDAWLYLRELTGRIRALQQPVVSEETASQALEERLRDMVEAEGVHFLWRYHEIHLGELWGYDYVEPLLRTYESAVYAVTDPKWVTDQVLDICDYIASASHDTSCWLPDREQVSLACRETIEAVGGATATRDAVSQAFELAVEGSGDPWGILAKVFRKVTSSVSDHTMERVADVVVRASQQAMRNVFRSALTSAQEVIHDRERMVALLLAADERTRAFWAFHTAEEANEGDRQRALEWLVEVLSECETKGDPTSFQSEPPHPPLFRALSAAASACGDPIMAANLLGVIYMATQREDWHVGIEHALPAVRETIAVLQDPASEAAVMYDAYILAITDGNDPSPAVDALLEVTRESIEQNPVVGLKVLLRGLSVEPAGWPPPTPAWMLPD